MNSATSTDLQQQLTDAWQVRAELRFLGQTPANTRTDDQSPTATVIAGQPGSGKSVFLEALRRSATLPEQAVCINPKELATLHPATPVLERIGRPDAIGTVINEAAQLASQLLNIAVNRRSDLVLCCAFDGADSIEHLLGFLQEQGYRVQVIALAVSPELSRQASSSQTGLTLAEQQEQTDFHDRMYNGFLAALNWLEQSATCYVAMLDRRGQLLAEKLPNVACAPGQFSGQLPTLESCDQVHEEFAGPHHSSTEPNGRITQDSTVAAHQARELPHQPVSGKLNRQQQQIERRKQYVATLRRIANAQQYGGY
ncbi:MAG: zeta toxin family protein [Planctomycetales bacterium]|nr:zeta toxin family protein [Planctomycetales bacterium]